MTFEEIKTIAETWFEWDSERRDYVTYTSAMLFARDMLEQGQTAERERMQAVIEAAQAVIDRWNTPLWKDVEPTAAVIYRLRDAIERAKP